MKNNFQHQGSPKVGVLITNLGTPDAPETGALRRYLAEFLSDPRVVEFPRLLWWCVLNFVILRIRPSRSAKAYKKVWTEQGSPLAVYTQAQCLALKEKLQTRYGKDLHVEFAMRYGNPSIAKTLEKLCAKGVTRLFLLPLYPQYSATTTASTFDALAADFKTRRWLPELRFLNTYHDHPAYIEALATSIREHWEQHGRAQQLLFSYHGIPLRYLHAGDPYHCYCHVTSRLVAEKLGLNTDEYQIVFQSRFGREPWLQPYADATLSALPKQGIKSVEVVCPGFAADCLETIEEINMENRQYFLEAGGESFYYIPALNTHTAHIHALETLCKENIDDWCKTEHREISGQRYTSHSHNNI